MENSKQKNVFRCFLDGNKGIGIEIAEKSLGNNIAQGLCLIISAIVEQGNMSFKEVLETLEKYQKTIGEQND